MPKVILFSQFPLPYAHIGSWTTLYRNYLESEHQIDLIICDTPQYYFPKVRYEHPQHNIGSKIRKAFADKPHAPYLNALDKVMADESQYIIQIVDNMGLAREVQNYLSNKPNRADYFLQYFYHGHGPYGFTSSFFEQLDEMIVLTQLSYESFKREVNVLPCRFSVLHNGISTDKFFAVDQNKKQALKRKHGFANKRILFWCSQDRPKKGLSIIRDAFRSIHNRYNDTVLVVVGTDNKKPQPGVFYLGRIPNDMLPEYYQMAEVFLFPTLCQEGFGMTLLEALYSGCYCIASAMGGVPEVLDYGRFGKLIENPHFVEAWIAAISEYLDGDALQLQHPGFQYDAQRWNSGMDAIIARAKSHFS